MSDWPAPRSAVPRRQNALKGCMASLPQVFQWSRVLGSNNKCIVIPADVQTASVTIEKQTQIKGRTKQMKLQHQDGLGSLAPVVSNQSAISSSSAWKVSDSNMPREMVGMDLLQVLHAKQEPFVLQDAIHEKRHPTRTPSSRELKFEAPPTRRSAKMKNDRTTSKHQGHATGDGYSAECQSQFCGAPKSPTTGSAAVVRRSRFPVESMVAMPSYQTASVGGGHSAAKAHSKVASLGRNPVKSPNKRALLMEAAARILEGSMNRRTSKRLSTSIRSLLEDLDKSKHVKEPLKPKEKFSTTVALHSESAEREEVTSPILVNPEERAAESTQHQNSHHLKCSSKQNSKSSCRNHLEMSQVGEEDILVMQKRVFPYDNALDAAEALPSLATPIQNPSSEQKNEYEQLHDDLCSGTKGIKKETVNQNIGGFKWSSSKALLHANTMLSEVILMEDQCPEHDYNSHVKESRAIVPSTSLDSPANFSPIVLMSICLPNFDYRIPSLIRNVLDDSSARHFIWGYHSAAAPFPVDSTENGEVSSPRTTGQSLNQGADETEYTNILRDTFVEAETQSSVMQLRLCNYSWWASDQNNSPENQLSTDYCAGCDSPVAATRPCFGKMWNEEITEEAASSQEYSSDQFQQASPVSVLEPVYEEELELTDSFDNFEETRQKLLEKVRRYEMLAHMDVDTLKKVSEEQISYAWEDDEWWEADYNYSCSSSNSSSQASPAHHSSSSDMETQVSRKCFMREPHVFSPEDDQSCYGQEEKMRPISSLLDCSTEKLEQPGLSSCRVLHSQRIVNTDNHIKEVAGKHGSRSIVAYMVNSLLHKDLAMSKWSSSMQEELEEVEVELESSFFEVLMWELLSDLLRAHFKPAFDLLENPVHHNSELSNMLPITT